MVRALMHVVSIFQNMIQKDVLVKAVFMKKIHTIGINTDAQDLFRTADDIIEGYSDEYIDLGKKLQEAQRGASEESLYKIYEKMGKGERIIPEEGRIIFEKGIPTKKPRSGQEGFVRFGPGDDIAKMQAAETAALKAEYRGLKPIGSQNKDIAKGVREIFIKKYKRKPPNSKVIKNIVNKFHELKQKSLSGGKGLSGHKGYEAYPYIEEAIDFVTGGG